MNRRDFLKLSESSVAHIAVAQTALAKFEHVVVLMMENRTFDNVDVFIRSRSTASLALSSIPIRPCPLFVNNIPGHQRSRHGHARPQPRGEL